MAEREKPGFFRRVLFGKAEQRVGDALIFLEAERTDHHQDPFPNKKDITGAAQELFLPQTPPPPFDTIRQLVDERGLENLVKEKKVERIVGIDEDGNRDVVYRYSGNDEDDYGTFPKFGR